MKSCTIPLKVRTRSLSEPPAAVVCAGCPGDPGELPITSTAAITAAALARGAGPAKRVRRDGARRRAEGLVRCGRDAPGDSGDDGSAATARGWGSGGGLTAGGGGAGGPPGGPGPGGGGGGGAA